MQDLYKVISSSPRVKHLLFWSALYLSFILLSLQDRPSISLVILEEALAVSSYALIVYFNFHVLIPTFLSKKRIVIYILALTTFLVLFTPIVALLNFTLYSLFGLSELKDQIDLRLIFVSLVLVAFLSTLFQILSEWLRHERDKRVLEQQKAQSELRFLKSQINPHFLFNTLNNLYALTLKKSDLAPEIVLKLSDMMRYMLYECNEKTVLLQKEIRYIENYLSLEELRQGEKVDIQFEINGEIGERRVAPLLFIPFIENCFKHGVNRQLTNAFVHLTINIEDDSIEMLLSNSKPDVIPGLYNKKPGGIGQINVRQQLDLIYPRQYDLKIEESPVAYSVQLKINL